MSKRSVSKLLGFFDALGRDLSGEQWDHRKQFAVDRLRARARKRARIPARGLKEEAARKFLALNDFVRDRPLLLTEDEKNNARDFIFNAVVRFNARSSTVPQDTDCFGWILENWRYGPGASFGLPGVTHPAVKIGSVQTVTEGALAYHKRLRGYSPYTAAFDSSRNGNTSVVQGSKLSTVPKNEETVRTIAIEPLGNMALQLGLGSFLEGVLSFVGLDISKQQPINSDFARRGSIDGGFATLDLSSASDLIGLDLVRELLPQPIFELIAAVRSPHIDIQFGDVRGPAELHMVSTMGNGFTFPLMTLIIVALIYAYRCTQRTTRRLYVDWGVTAVFGDDIIVRNTEFDGVVDVLGRAGFIVNIDKSFNSGGFRESCGGDYFEGYDVTPFYVKSLARDSDVYVALNQVSEWCAKHEIVLYNALRYLRSLLKTVLLVPEWNQPDSGWRTALAPRKFKFLRPVVRRENLESSFFLVPLAIAGYVESDSNGDPWYTPRPLFTIFKRDKARIPSGFLDGADRVSRSARDSSFVNLLVDLTS